MIEYLSAILPIIIYLLLIVLISISIVLGIKLIITMNKVEKVVDDVQDKVSALDSIFNVLEFASGKVSGAFERVIDFATGIVEKLFIGRRERNEEDEEENR